MRIIDNLKLFIIDNILIFIIGIFFKLFEFMFEKPILFVIDRTNEVIEHDRLSSYFVYSYIVFIFTLAIIPFFINFIFGLIFLVILILFSILVMSLIDKDVNKFIVLFFGFPHIFSIFVIGFVLSFFIKNKKHVTDIHLRKIKIKKLKRKLFIKKLKFWEK